MDEHPPVWRAGMLITTILVVILPAWVLWRGLPALSLSFWRALTPQLFASVYVLILSLLLSCPLALATATYLNEYADPRLARLLSRGLEMQAATPAVVVGMLGMIVFVEQMHLGFTLIGGAVSLGVLNLPFLVRVAQEAMALVPPALREGSLALGATRFNTWRRIILPLASSSFSAGLVLAAGRGLGEAAALLFTAGAVPASRPFSLNPFGPGATLAVHLWYLQAEGAGGGREAEGTAAVLLLLWLGLVLLAKLFETANGT